MVAAENRIEGKDAVHGRHRLGFFERYLTLWVLACIGAGIALGKAAPGVARALDGLTLQVNGAPVVSVPIAVCLFFMMYPIMVKIDFAEVLRAGRNVKPVSLTLAVNWLVKPFTMVAISALFLGVVFLGFIGPEAVDHVKMPLGLDLEVGAHYGEGTVVLVDGVRVLQVPLWRSYLAGCILLGIAPCTAMVLVWGFLARGNDGHTLVMVAINSLVMLFLYGPLGGFLLGVGRLPVPWQALLLSIGVYVALPLVAGYASRRWIIAARGEAWFRGKFLHLLTPITIGALLITLVLLFSFKGEVILSNPLTILWIAVPLFLQTVLIFWLTYGLARGLRLTYEDAAPSAMIGASNHFEVAIATAVMLFGLSSGAALATVVGVLIEVPVMLLLVRICLRTSHWFPARSEETGRRDRRTR
jgi:ACR3 family arsenite transporter